MVEILNYLTTTRPNITYYVSVLTQFMEKPLEIHWNATKGVLRYLKGTLDYGIKYTDSYWVGNLDDQRSTTGYAFGIGSRTVSWSSKKTTYCIFFVH
jgi:hypothetical protein